MEYRRAYIQGGIHTGGHAYRGAYIQEDIHTVPEGIQESKNEGIAYRRTFMKAYRRACQEGIQSEGQT